mgnify:FL=1
MSRRRLHPLAALVCWMAVGIVALLFALAWVVSQREVADVQLDRAHLAGMELGQTMCLGFRSEMERGQAVQPAAVPQPRRGGGLL